MTDELNALQEMARHSPQAFYYWVDCTKPTVQDLQRFFERDPYTQSEEFTIRALYNSISSCRGLAQWSQKNAAIEGIHESLQDTYCRIVASILFISYTKNGCPGE